MSTLDELQTVVIVTGAARGIGRAMALGLAAAGSRVGAMDLAASGAEMAELVSSAVTGGFGDRIFPIRGDIAVPEDCVAAVENIVRHFGSVHGLVNNAGQGMQDIGRTANSLTKKFFEMDAKAWRSTFDVNVNGAFFMARTIAPYLVTQGWGRIVNITTSYPTMQKLNFSPYGPTKAALEAATVIWSKDLAETGVTVNALLPGGRANTRMIPVDEVSDREALIQPEIMVPPVTWLMSVDSDGITGRRFIAKNWDPRLTPREAALNAGAPAGWQQM
jgi:3-oxoacyl-[acyl-carrier protein] reductase